MNLDFLKIDIRNFKSFNGQHMLDLEKLGIGLHFLCGDNLDEPECESNGAGKTSLIDAFRWCLTGKTSDDLKGPDIRPWNGTTEATSVSLIFAAGSEEHVLTRSAGKGNALILDGKPCDQYEVDNLIRLSDDVISHTILFGQGKPLFFDLPPAEKLSLFSTVLNLDRWETRAERASEQAKKMSGTLIKLDGSRTGVENSIHSLEGMLQEQRDKSRSFNRDKTTKLRNLHGDLGGYQTELEKLTKLRDDANLDSDAGTEIGPLRIQIEAASQEMIRTVNERSRLVLVIGHDERELNALGGADTCPTCGQSLKGTNLAAHKRELQKKIRASRADLVKADEIHETALQHHDSLRAKLRDFEAREDRANHTRANLDPKIGQIKGSMDGIRRMIADLEKQENPYEEQVQSTRTQLSSAQEDLKTLDGEITRISKDVEHMTFWARGFKEVRLLLVDEVLAELELVTNDMLQDVGLPDWRIAYEVEKETQRGTVKRSLTVFIQSPRNKKPVRWEAFSGGERQRLRLVGSLALGEVLLNHAGVNPNIEILDEPSQHMSNRGVKGLCTYLAWRASTQDKTIFLVDHQAVASSEFSSTVTVLRDEAGSRIEL